MTTITLARRTQRKLKKKKFVNVQTTFITEEGPAVGTVWFDRECPAEQPTIVLAINDDKIDYEDGRWDFFESFMACVQEGRYVLIGVTPTTYTHTVT